MTCASKLEAASDRAYSNKSRTSDLLDSAFMSSVPPNLFDNNLESPRWSSRQTFADISRPHSRPNQIKMCDASTLIYKTDPERI